MDGMMSAVSLKNREMVWEFETYGQISASPNIAEFKGRNALIFGSYDNYLYSVDAKTGEEINRFESGYYINGAVALWNGHAIFGGCDAWLRIIDCQSGVTTDSLELDAYVPASPAVMGDYCYVGDYSGSVYQIILNRGKIDRYSKIIEGSDDNGSFVSVPAVSTDMLYILSADRYLYAISRRDGSVKWKYLLKGGVGESSPVVADSKVIVCTKTGVVSILNATNGKLLWEYDTGEQILGSPAVLQGSFMILTSKGTLFCFGSDKK
jgi:outer membrane protein assembly factor BamB